MSLNHNNDFLSQSKKPTEQELYPEYFSLLPYERKCLVSMNYWRVMYGQKIVEVPPSDTYYHKYFDKGCYERKEVYQLQKQREKEFNKMLEKYKDGNK
jgi:hypothetical protein